MKRYIYMKILSLLPRKTAHKILFKKYLNQELNLSNPQTLNEKIQWLIVYYYGEKEGKLADKQRVKEYIKKLNIPNLHIPKTYKTLNSQNETIEYKNLPNKFVLKTNHGSGQVFICEDKTNFDLDNSVKKLLKSLKKDYTYNLLEYHYSNIKPLIMFEEYLIDNSNSRPLDYKFFCYDGYVDSVMVCSNRGTKTKKDFFNQKWEHLNYSKEDLWSKEKIEKPKNLEEMFQIASKISKGFPFVRVDLYNIDGKIYFGEMTFTPAAGLSTTYTPEGDLHLGKYINIKGIKKEGK